MMYLNLLPDVFSWKLKRSSQYAGLRDLTRKCSEPLPVYRETDLIKDLSI